MARRFFIFSIGLLMGSFLVYQILIKGTDRELYGSWLPESRVLKKIRTSLDKNHQSLNCWTTCASIFNSDIDYLLNEGDVDFSRSITKGINKSYWVAGELANKKNIEVKFNLDGDSTAVIHQIVVEKVQRFSFKNCDCDSIKKH